MEYITEPRLESIPILEERIVAGGAAGVGMGWQGAAAGGLTGAGWQQYLQGLHHPLLILPFFFIEPHNPWRSEAET